MSENIMDQVVLGLWMGRSPPDAKALAPFDLVVNLEGTAPFLQENGDVMPRYVWAPMEDCEIQNKPEMPDQIRFLASLINLALMSGKRVLVHCSAGMNRSGIVAARVLIGQGFSSEKAIEAVRRARGEYALCNTSFETWLQGEVGEEVKR